MKPSSMKIKTLFLVISNFITGTLMFGFSIILSRKIGSEGMGLYQLVMPIYSLFLCIAGGGITISASKIAAELKGSHKTNELYKTVRAVCIFELCWSSLASAFLIIMSKYIADNILNEPKTQYLVISLAPAIIFISLTSVYKGVYYGLQKIVVPAVIDIVEKFIRIGFITIAFNIILTSKIELSAAVAGISLSLGELSSLILFYTAFIINKHKTTIAGKSDNSLQLVINILKLAFPLAINGILSTIFSTFTTLIIPDRLHHTGMTHEASVMVLGKLQGMVSTIIFYPTIIVGAMNVLLVPALSEAISAKKNNIVNRNINTALIVASVTAFSSAAIMLSCSNEIGFLFYKDTSLGHYISQMCVSMPILYLEITTFAILNGLGKQKNILINSTVLSVIELITLYILLGLPSINVTGYAINFFIISIAGFVLNLYIIKRSLAFKLKFIEIFIYPGLCSILVYIISKYLIIHLCCTPIVIALSYFVYFAIYLSIGRWNKGK